MRIVNSSSLLLQVNFNSLFAIWPFKFTLDLVCPISLYLQTWR